MTAMLTTATLRALRPRDRTYEVTCGALAGFAVRILPTGKKVFVVRHRVDGRDSRLRLGVWGADLPLEEARRLAMAVLAGVPIDAARGASTAAASDADDGLTHVPAPSPHELPPSPVGRASKAHAHHRARGGASSSPASPLAPPATAPHSVPSALPTALPTARESDTSAYGTARERDTAARERDTAAPLSTRTPEPLRPTASTLLRDLCERFLVDYVDVYLKPGTAANYRRVVRQHILPALGDRPFDALTRREVRDFHASLRGRPAVANHALCILGSLYTRIIRDWELADIRSPTAGIRRFPTRRVDRFLSPDERARVLATLDAGLALPAGKPGHIERFSAWAIRLLMLTGFRRSEILGLTWPMVDWQHSCFHFPDTKTGQRSAIVSGEVIALLREIHDATGNHRTGPVIRGHQGTHITQIGATWGRLRVAAGIPDVRLHDLRHSFASDALMAGVPLAVVGEMLGHKQAATTQRYAHLAPSVVRDAVEHTTRRITAQNPGPADRPFHPLTDLEWRRVAPLLDAHRPRGGKPVDLRAVVDGIRWVLQRAAKWREVPSQYGAPTTVWRWYKRWTEDGTWTKLGLS